VDNVPIERALLSRVIQDKDFHTLEKAQISEEFFATPEGVEIFRYLKSVYHDPVSTGQVPSLEMVQYRFPTFFPFNTNDSVPILAQQLRLEKVRLEILALSQVLSDVAERNPLEAMAALRAESSKISALAEVGRDLSMAGAYNMLLAQYEMVQQGGGLLGIPYPWEQLNEETQGMQPGQFIVLFGRPKSMKTWLGIEMGCHAYLQARRRVLIYTREMTPELMSQRVAARLGRVDYKAYKNGKLQPELKARVFNILQDLIEDEKSAGAAGLHQPYIIIVSDRGAGGSGGGGIGWLQAKIREYRPDLVIVDGMYLMKDDRSGQRTVDWPSPTSPRTSSSRRRNTTSPSSGSLKPTERQTSRRVRT
jgi:hypothetical protein